jgi:hypothetical protein
MKILIAGDSFCNKLSHEESNFAWTRQLENMLHNCKVTCTGEGASSVFSALQQVKNELEIDSSYDTIIVIVTNHERLYQTSDPIISNLPHALAHEKLYKQSNNKDEKLFNKIESARMYYEHLHEHDLGVFILESCLTELQHVVGNKRLILFPAFETFKDSAFADELLNGYGFTLLDMVHRENKNFNETFEKDWMFRFTERVSIDSDPFGKVNHMSTGNQTLLARYFAQLIHFGKSEIKLNSFSVLPKKDFHLYYSPIE